MIISMIYNLEADSGHILRNKYTGDLRHYVENETDIDAWEEIEIIYDDQMTQSNDM